MRINPLQRIDNPPAPRGLPGDMLPTWQHLAPQVCRWSSVTALDLAGLEILTANAFHLDRLAVLVGEADPADRPVLIGIRDEFRDMLAGWCSAFLLGPEVIEEITMPSGRTLAALVGAGGEPWPSQ